MRAELISTGTELLLGQILNENARYLSQRLSALGIDVYFQTVVGDNEERLALALRQAMARADVIITTGGLGPTQDDLTKETVARELNLEMVLDEPTLDKIRAFFKKIEKPMPKINIKQAYFPAGAKILPNQMGTAPGAVLETGRHIIIILPGPPAELRPMFEHQVEPYLKAKEGSGAVIKSRVLRIFGIGESSAQEKLADLFLGQSNPSLAFNAKAGELQIRITAKAAGEEAADSLISAMEARIRARIGKHIFGVDNETLEEAVGKLLKEHQLTIALAESCTGGLISTRLTEIPGSSEYFLYGVVSYSNEAKAQILGVRQTTLNKYGAVSAETAREMAEGVRKIKQADIGLAVTGIAGPGGGTPEKPVGLVYIGLSTQDITFAKAFNFAGDRKAVRLLTSTAALNMVRRYITEKKTY